MPPYADMRSVSAEHQAPGSLYRTISRATLVDQDTGNVYQVTNKLMTSTISSFAKNQLYAFFNPFPEHSHY